MVRFDILTLFPGMFASTFESSLLKKAREKGLIEIKVHDIREYTEDRHRMADDYPYGGGSGMGMKVEPIARALEHTLPDRKSAVVIMLSPQGEVFNQRTALELSKIPRLVMVCGHYEGVDERVGAHLVDREISIGDYVLTGGEVPAMVVVDAVARLVPGVLGNRESAQTDSFSSTLLEYPQFTRPAEYRGWRVPEVLLSGNHREIENWRRRESLRKTYLRRPDLLEKVSLTEGDRKMLSEIVLDEECKG
jgi:tRNA (guanine37-N1)-methyltransferase